MLFRSVGYYALTALLGLGLGGYPYLKDLGPTARTLPSSPWAEVEQDPDKLQNTLDYSAEFDLLLNVTPPPKSADVGTWVSFLNHLDTLPLGKHYSSTASSTPIFAWYSYVAIHKPEALLHPEAGKGAKSKLGELFEYGLLTNWADFAPDINSILFNSKSAIKAYAKHYSVEQAQKQAAAALFAVLERSNSGKPTIDLEIIPFLLPALDEAALHKLETLLLEKELRIDPRDVKQLLLTGLFQKEDLLTIIRRYAYSSKSMSSYMLEGAQLGAAEYVDTMVGDIPDNASQPGNFYCSACALALLSDGLLGERITQAKARGLLNIQQSQPGVYLLTETASTGSLVMPNE